MQMNDAPAVTGSAAVSARVERWRADEDRSQAWLARRIGMHPATLGRKLAGDSGWTVDEVEQLAEVLDLTAAQLVAPIDVDDAPTAVPA